MGLNPENREARKAKPRSSSENIRRLVKLNIINTTLPEFLTLNK
ncbi:hypothetical protein LD85_0701 [Saccharolobus islandicus L.D.8.5]|uniref:Uncharacterized protein n=1 Tax=Saccharolobus islandicus (strain L.D.8.5 / Lassen \|nr:hypothetical protein LD85_0701 [Sulfolobus islandicus L.D.8.5]